MCSALFIPYVWLVATSQRLHAEVVELRRRVADESGKRDQLEQVSSLLRQQLRDVTAEAEAGAATIAKLKAFVADGAASDTVDGGARVRLHVRGVCLRVCYVCICVCVRACVCACVCVRGVRACL
jgi:hypothetical protein